MKTIDTGNDTAEDRNRYKEQETNARLIAAAPDLLAACELALESGDDYAAEQAIRAAVRKAKGQ